MSSNASLSIEYSYTELTIIEQNLKRCLSCKELKPLNEFNKHKYRVSGYSNDCKKCYREKYLSKWDGSHYKSTGMSGHWTKWGGAIKDVIQEDLSDIWYCQLCGTEQPKDLTPYKHEYPEGEWIRICSNCYSERH